MKYETEKEWFNMLTKGIGSFPDALELISLLTKMERTTKLVAQRHEQDKGVKFIERHIESISFGESEHQGLYLQVKQAGTHISKAEFDKVSEQVRKDQYDNQSSC